MDAMITNHMYDKEHHTTEMNIDLAAIKLPAASSCVCRYMSVSLQDIQTIYRSMRPTITLINNRIN